MSFDQKLKALRLENKMTQEYVARKLNVARSTIAGYETKSRQPSHEKLAEKSDGRYTKEDLEAVVDTLTGTFSYSVDKKQLTLSEREYGEQMIFTKK